MKVLSVVVPVYNNAGSLPALASRLAAVEESLRELGVALELVFVDDGSQDDSLAALLAIRESRPSARVVKLTRNFGALHAVKCGYRFVKGDCFALLAADLQDPPELLVELVQRWLGGEKFVVCTRDTRDDPWTTRMFSAAYYATVRALVMRDYPRGGYDLAVMDKSFLPHFHASSKATSPLLLACWLGYRPSIVPYHREKRIHGKSGWTWRKKVSAFFDVMLGFSVEPLRLMATLGFGVAGLSFVYGTVVVVHALVYARPVPGFPTTVALISFLLGVVIVMLGLIGEYLMRILDQLNGRPEVVIERIYE